jgi:hypothetical protein
MRSPSEAIDIARVEGFVSRWRTSQDPALIDALSDAERADITALLWLACDLYAPSELPDARFEAHAAQCPSSICRLAIVPGLPDRIEAGIAKLDHSSRFH